ncbi:hypothetical protein K402DRAFT_388356 [Aulographum hederae CBS 113979]|uniref:F-box domain-containing protein n=1 Tax=Aulographum hederae CBS 113979 TaxID=1176131 RepID=A0A6G1HF05_9PEZI|nr:hypothetical protein K402DRAFT_388356 [Aulographum hederae CBS 113979]
MPESCVAARRKSDRPLGFMDLPAELRIEIYRDVLYSEDLMSYFEEPFPRKYVRDHICIPLALVSNQIFHELTDVYYTEAFCKVYLGALLLDKCSIEGMRDLHYMKNLSFRGANDRKGDINRIKKVVDKIVYLAGLTGKPLRSLEMESSCKRSNTETALTLMESLKDVEVLDCVTLYVEPDLLCDGMKPGSTDSQLLIDDFTKFVGGKEIDVEFVPAWGVNYGDDPDGKDWHWYNLLLSCEGRKKPTGRG